tara:strand:- start:2757 stop:2936 length:180 start_codon:yes stop_codon:yes gene_type:complete
MRISLMSWESTAMVKLDGANAGVSVHVAKASALDPIRTLIKRMARARAVDPFTAANQRA